MADPNGPRAIEATCTDGPPAFSHNIRSRPSPSMASNRDSGVPGVNPPTEELDLPQESKSSGSRADSEPADAPGPKPLSITLGSIDYLVSPRGISPHPMKSSRWIRTEYANQQLGNSSKKSLNVESPSFTPAQIPAGKKSTFSTNATPFTPRGAASCKNLVTLYPGEIFLHKPQPPTLFYHRMPAHLSSKRASPISHHRITT